MSAYLCTPHTLLTVAVWSTDHPLTHQTEVAQRMRVIHDENIASLQARYGDRAEEGYSFQELTDFCSEHNILMATQLSPETVYDVVKNYQYQACEHEGWHTSEALRWSLWAKDRAFYRLKKSKETVWGLDAWPSECNPSLRRIL